MAERSGKEEVGGLGAGVDGSVRRIDTAYDEQGNAYLFTSYADTAATTVVNQVERQFDGLGQMTAEYQSISGAVNTSSTPAVRYAYTEMGGGQLNTPQNNSRLVSMTYPNGRVLDYNYFTGTDAAISRLSSISDNSGTLDNYVYLGLGTVVQRNHSQTGVNETFISQNNSTGDAGDSITGLDRFGRIVDDAFINALTGVKTDEFQYTYDRDSNALTKTNTLDTALNETYTYNGLNELTGYTRSNGDSQSYTPDALGNFTSVVTNGTTQTRTSNAQNELTSVSGATTPVYDNNGNLTTDEAGQTYTYDAWNRLVKVVSGSNTVTYSFDALGRRITETTNSTTQDLYFGGSNVIEERQSGKSAANYQNVWEVYATNTLVERDRDTTGAGTLNERLYYQHDANNNVTALVSTTGAVDERDLYVPYGTVSVFTPSWAPLSSTQYDNLYTFQTMRVTWLTSNLHALFRDYRPTIFVWTGMDPIGFAGGQLSLAGFEGDNPVNKTDPSGLLGLGGGLLPPIGYPFWWSALFGGRKTGPDPVPPIPPPPRPVPTEQTFPAGKYGQFSITQKNTNGSRFRSDVDISFKPNSACNCRDVQFIQIARIVNARGENLQTREHLLGRKTVNNWFVDRRSESDIYGWYNMNPNGFIPDGGRPGVSGDLNDHPGRGSSGIKNATWEFETCAVCMKGQDVGKVYGCIKWGFTVDNNLKLYSHARTVSDTPSPDFMEAVAAWNKQAAGSGRLQWNGNPQKKLPALK